uniref:CLIP domain-containing serine protease n=1 Tax=Anopheles epiroticus TaxID=199890 RepID=A0A182PNA5_9DIPT
MIANRLTDLLIVTLLALTGPSVSALELGQDCVNPVGEAGTCVLFRECQPLIDIYNKPVNTPDDTQFLTESRCGVFEHLNANCVTPVGEPGKCILFRECEPLVAIYSKPLSTHEDTQFLMQSRCGALQRKTLVSFGAEQIVCCGLLEAWTASSTAQPNDEQTAPRNVKEPCIDPAGKPGKCISIRDCEPLLHVLLRQAEVSQSERMFLTRSRCNFEGRQPLVCCADPSPNEASPLPSPPRCGVREATRLIGGQLTQLDDYPWAALIEYEKPDGNTGFHCGGTLINQNHILTAAHCVSSLPAGWSVHRVRLGEWDLSATLDCEYDYCNGPPIDANVSKIIVHEGYAGRNGSFNHDIAIIRLEQEVDFSSQNAPVFPICLPIAQSIRRKNLWDTYSTIVGWGKTPTSDGISKKLMVDLGAKAFQECSSLQERSEKGQSNQMCTLGKRHEREICSADSGGGLTRFLNGFQYLIGIAGIGEHKCGTVDTPAQGQRCINPAGQPGKCIPFRECSSLLSIYSKGFTSPEESRFLAASRCGEKDRRSLVSTVCCASEQPARTNSLPVSPQCGVQLTDRIVGGQSTELEEFPWTALIEYRKPTSGYDFNCGGSLINARYTLTAAHCVQSLPPGWQL